MENKTLIEYCGSVKYETIGELIHRFKMQVPKLGIPIGIYKRILLIIIESLENIMKHSELPDNQEKGTNYLATLSVVRSSNQYIITSSNSITNKGVSLLKSKLDFLNALDQQGLKAVYKETITNGVFTKTGGAGLGLIEIVKISGNPIVYDFCTIDDTHTIYKQKVIVNDR